MTSTLACMYPFIVNEEKMWVQLAKQVAYPMPQLWPKQVLKRYMHFHKVFGRQRRSMFENYEQSGGDFHGEEPSDEDCTTEEEKKDGLQELDCDQVF